MKWITSSLILVRFLPIPPMKKTVASGSTTRRLPQLKFQPTFRPSVKNSVRLLISTSFHRPSEVSYRNRFYVYHSAQYKNRFFSIQAAGFLLSTSIGSYSLSKTSRSPCSVRDVIDFILRRTKSIRSQLILYWSPMSSCFPTIP